METRTGNTRLPLVSEAEMDAECRALFQASVATGTPAPNFGRVLANNPALMKTFYAFWQALFWESKVPVETMEAVRLLTVHTYQCEMCADISALEHPLVKGNRDLEKLFNFENEDYPAASKAALAYARALLQGAEYVTDAIFAELYKHYGPAEILEISMLVAVNMGFLPSVTRSWGL